MLPAELFELYRQFSSWQILMTFKGAFSQALLVELGEAIKKQSGDESKVQKMFAVFVEMAQNILYYSAEREMHGGKEVGVGIITICENKDSYAILSGNAIETLHGQKMLHQCERLAAMTKDELKAAYKAQRESASPEGSKGAGLGLIDMMRKSDAPPDFSLIAIDDRLSFFILNIIVKKNFEF